ncbi:MAG: hypothetical protein O3A53_11440 [Acidobacteria bacterium]|nr:hypothetical protein [Acidobacteriota bacterium]MDA1235404.1 hypothetical protein [Acidobacteriota bacterium]
MRVLLIFLLAMTPLPFAAAQDATYIYVYETLTSGKRSWLAITFDGEPAAELRRGMFFAIRTTPGSHMVGLNGGVSVAVELKAGEEAFVRLGRNRLVGAPPIPKLYVSINPTHNRMTNLRYVKENKIHSDAVARSDPRPPPRLKTRED